MFTKVSGLQLDLQGFTRIEKLSWLHKGLQAVISPKESFNMNQLCKMLKTLFETGRNGTKKQHCLTF